MAATMDFYSSGPLQSDSFGGELMEALEPFMRSASSSSSTTPSPSHNPSPSPSPSPSYSSISSTSYNNFLSFSPFPTTASLPEPNLYPDACSTSSAHLFSNGFSIQDPLLGLQQQQGSIGLNNLTQFQIQQIQTQMNLQNQIPNQIFWQQPQQPQQTICESLAESQKQGKREKQSTSAEKKRHRLGTTASVVKESENVASSSENLSLGGGEVEACVKVESSSSDGSAGSSPLSDLTFQDNTEPCWDVILGCLVAAAMKFLAVAEPSLLSVF
ncbi:hypothetical protein Pint_08318 [Pistacia integerrima]|uniref:Uncharacterized protein n=1 Tax=Pistacia integerrima TaxID=434235 RepID=A0ACC0XYD3_9ROSI|nr:hypothetical protein Pint_08318 [Pistacia integerrima]